MNWLDFLNKYLYNLNFKVNNVEIYQRWTSAGYKYYFDKRSIKNQNNILYLKTIKKQKINTILDFIKT